MGGQGAGGQAKQAVVNEVWERGEIVMCIAVPDTCILASKNRMPLVSLSCSINWLAIFGGSGLLNGHICHLSDCFGNAWQGNDCCTLQW